MHELKVYILSCMFGLAKQLRSILLHKLAHCENLLIIMSDYPSCHHSSIIYQQIEGIPNCISSILSELTRTL